MNGAISVFNFAYGFGLGLLRGWFYPVLFVLLLIALLIVGTLLRRLYAKMAQRD